MVTDVKKFKQNKSTLYLNVDEIFSYRRFYNDFGPLHIGNVVEYCKLVEEALEKLNAQKNGRVLHCTSSDLYTRSNMACLMGSFMILKLGMSPEDAYRPFSRLSPPLLPFRDASIGPTTFSLSVLDVLRGISQAHRRKLLDISQFPLKEYYRYREPKEGNLNWIVPNKLLAFASPADRKEAPSSRHPGQPPEQYIDYFTHKKVSDIIRLNPEKYDTKSLEDAGFKVHALPFPDGGSPSEDLVDPFLEIMENAQGAVAVHCLAGLGRTGTMIGCYLMKHYLLTAGECIGWLRLCRPGSVIGPQQHFLVEHQQMLWNAGARVGAYRMGSNGSGRLTLADWNALKRDGKPASTSPANTDDAHGARAPPRHDDSPDFAEIQDQSSRSIPSATTTLNDQLDKSPKR